MRPVARYVIVIAICLAAQLWLVRMSVTMQEAQADARTQAGAVVRHLGLSDLCVATDARYIRHPAVTDPVAPYMDHPGSIEHFPTGSFWAAPGRTK